MKRSEELRERADVAPSDASSNDGIVLERAILILASELAALREQQAEQFERERSDAYLIRDLLTAIEMSVRGTHK